MSTLTITHTAAEGTLIDGTARGDGTAPVLKAEGWRWGRSIGLWYVPRSRDKAPMMGMIDRTAAALREAGCEVELAIDDAARTTAEVEADKVARQAARAEALDAKAARAQKKGQQAWAADRRAVEALPPMGEPIKVGHHSEGRHRRAIERANRAMHAACEAEKAKQTAERAAAAAASVTGARYGVVTVGNRIERLEAELRSAQRSSLAQEIARLTDELTYWRDVRKEQIDSGLAIEHGPDTIKVGDWVEVSGRWCRVVRVNQKSVSVETGYSWTSRVEFHKITNHRAD